MAQKSLPAGRLGRLWQMGRLASGVAGGAIGEGARQLGRGQRPGLQQMLLTPANLTRIRDRLSEMRGAAMKVGQLISMESGELLPPELSGLFEQLREQAHPMPLGEVNQVLKGAWGEGWDTKFKRFNFTPLAAASIGQVHEAITNQGKRLAVKLQYPGVKRSIDSDIDNVSLLLRWSGLIPETLDLRPLLDEAKQQLHNEADYQAEAEMLTRFAGLVADEARVKVPRVEPELSTENVLAMQFLEGLPIDAVAEQSREERKRVALVLLEIALREVFEWGLVQTDPNFANYRYDPLTGQVQLLDFGACRHYSEDRRDALLKLLKAGLADDQAMMLDAAIDVGYLQADTPDAHREGMAELLLGALEPLRSERFAFGQSDLARRMSARVMELRRDRQFLMLPPPDVLFLHRKLGGLYLLLTRLQVTLPVRYEIERLGYA